jgi:hypothetical protein
MSKAAELLPKIQEASTQKEALAVLHVILETLHLTSNYTRLVSLKNKLEEYKDRYNEITDDYQKSEKSLRDMTEARTELNFIYRDISDKLSFEIYKNKIFFEENKTAIRAESIKSLKHNEEVQKDFNVKSASGLRDIVGLDNSYKEYIENASISYGLYQELNSTLNSMRMFIDLLASSIKNEQLIIQKDVK